MRLAAVPVDREATANAVSSVEVDENLVFAVGALGADDRLKVHVGSVGRMKPRGRAPRKRAMASPRAVSPGFPAVASGRTSFRSSAGSSWAIHSAPVRPRKAASAAGARGLVPEITRLAVHFLGMYARRHGRGELSLSSASLEALRATEFHAAGGFPTDSLTEDSELAFRLIARGAETGRPPVVVAVVGAQVFTEVPVTLAGFVRQRTRWFAGFLTTLFRFHRLVLDSRGGGFGIVRLPLMVVDAVLTLVALASLVVLVREGASARPQERVAGVLFERNGPASCASVSNCVRRDR